jgi:hypothetical protein
VFLTLSEGILQSLAGFWSAGFGWLVGLMLLNPTGGTPVQRGTDKGELQVRIVTTNVRLLMGGCGGSVTAIILGVLITGGES